MFVLADHGSLNMLISLFIKILMREKKYILVLVFLVGIFFNYSYLSSNKANAQENSVGLSISPLTFELTANPGDALYNKIKIYNPSDLIVSVKMEAEDFRAVGEKGQVIVAPEEETTYSLKRWVSMDPLEFVLEPREQKFIDFIITVPENAEPGGKYGTILASTTGTISDNKVGGSAIAQKVGALVLLTVSGDVKEGLIVKDFSVPDFSEYGPVPFTIRFENQGSVHVRPKGFITIADWRGEKAVDIEFTQSNVIPGTIREIDAKWNTKWLFGKYTATLVGSYGTSNTPFEPYVITFWVFPWKMAIGAFLALLIIFTFFYKSRRRWKMAAKALFKGSAE